MYKAIVCQANGNVTLLRARSRKGVMRKMMKLEQVTKITLLRVISDPEGRQKVQIEV